MAETRNTRVEALQERVRQFTRVEKAFYGSIVLTMLVLAISVVFMQSKLLQIQYELTDLNNQVQEKKTELDDAKQEVNELKRRNRLAEIASSEEMTQTEQNVVAVGKPEWSKKWDVSLCPMFSRIVWDQGPTAAE